MSLNYTSGNPANLTAGAAANMVDISGPFTDIKTFLADSSGAVGDTILTSPNNATYKDLGYGQFAVIPAAVNGQYILPVNGTATVLNTTSSVTRPLYFDPADHTVVGKTTKIRFRATVVTNATAPGVNLTIQLCPVTAFGGAAGNTPFISTVGAATCTSTFTTPGASSTTTQVSSEVTAPSAGLFIWTVTTSGATVANSNEIVATSLQLRQV